jgi:hypothetical protein
MIDRKEPAVDLILIDRLGEAEESRVPRCCSANDAGAIISSAPSINGGRYMGWCDAFSAWRNVRTVHRRPIQIEQLGLI